MIRKMEIGIGGRSLSRGTLPWVEQLADNLHLKGAIFTRADGSIRIVAEGEELALGEFAKKVENGNLFGSVENFFVRWQNPSPNHGNFHVLVGA